MTRVLVLASGRAVFRLDAIKQVLQENLKVTLGTRCVLDEATSHSITHPWLIYAPVAASEDALYR